MPLYLAIYFTLLHSLPIIVLMLSFILIGASFKRIYYYAPVIILLIYAIMNIGYTLNTDHPIYPGIDYKNFISYAIMFSTFFILFGSLEVGRYAKGKLYGKKILFSIAESELIEKS